MYHHHFCETMGNSRHLVYMELVAPIVILEWRDILVMLLYMYIYLEGGFNQYHLYHHDALCLVYIQMVIQDYSIQN